LSKSAVLVLKVPDQYNKAALTEIIRALGMQVDSLSEGRIDARYQAQTSVPVSVGANVGDVVWDSNTTVRGSVAPGVAASYVRLGWVCTAGDATNPVWQEIRTLTGA
jgi:hypothetical protein